MKLGQQPAFAMPGSSYQTNHGGTFHLSQSGINQRLYLAGIAMQGLLARNVEGNNVDLRSIAINAFHMADLLLEQENL